MTYDITSNREGEFMIALKITTVGNSAGVVLPREVLARLKVQKGDTVYLVETPDGFRITPYDEEFARQMEAAERVMREDRDILRALAK
jgi:putative addiction module antidote